MSVNQENTKSGQQSDFIRIQDFLYMCLSKWRWFLLSVVVVLGIAVVYILRTPPTYVMTAEVLVKENSRTQSIGGDVASMFASMGMSPGRTNVNNELRAMSSPSVLLEAGKRLALDVNYHTDGRFHKTTLYGSNQPVKISMPDLADSESAGLTVKLLKSGAVELSKFTRRKEKFAETVTTSLNDTITTPLGRVSIQPTPYYEKWVSEEARDIYVVRTDIYKMTDIIRKNLRVLSDEDNRATVIDLSYTDIVPQRAKDILNTILAVYQEDWMRDKNELTTATSMFITDRLTVIEQELGDVDQNISSYKSKNLLPDIEAASSMYMEQSQQSANRILALNTRLSMARYIHNYLTSNVSGNRLLPLNSGIESANIESQIAEYNTLQLQRNNLVANSSEKNPLVVDMDQSLAAIRSAIISSVENLEVTLSTQIADLQKNDRQITEQIVANPDQARYLMSVGREQKIKEALYLFLLQKREENELSRTFTAYNTRMLTPPQGSLTPIAPQKDKILLIAFVIALLIPTVIIFLRENMNTKIRGRKDLEDVTMPFIGEIPLVEQPKKRLLFGKKQQSEKSIVVKEGRRDIVNEAFRVLRTNLEFMTGAGDSSNVIAITSFNPGSGKSFILINLATSLALKGKKILVIDGDMRHGSTSVYVDSPSYGLSDYLNGRIPSPSEVIVPYPEQENLDILPVGTIPPNPTELLVSKRLGELISSVRKQYDYVFVDCPPVEVVADTQIIEKQVDRTIFVVRAGLLERSMLGELERIYEQKRYKSMSLILNGTTNGNNSYGYQYGYSYGYGYGQGYHYAPDEKQGRRRK
jgi:capsular exopolysaccharide synthesis family protein